MNKHEEINNIQVGDFVGPRYDSNTTSDETLEDLYGYVVEKNNLNNLIAIEAIGTNNISVVSVRKVIKTEIPDYYKKNFLVKRR